MTMTMTDDDDDDDGGDVMMMMTKRRWIIVGIRRLYYIYRPRLYLFSTDTYWQCDASLRFKRCGIHYWSLECEHCEASKSSLGFCNLSNPSASFIYEARSSWIPNTSFHFWTQIFPPWYFYTLSAGILDRIVQAHEYYITFTSYILDVKMHVGRDLYSSDLYLREFSFKISEKISIVNYVHWICTLYTSGRVCV